MNLLMILPGLAVLYAVGAILLLLYGLNYYRIFNRKGREPKTFPFLFLLLSITCFAFLWFSFRPPAGNSSYSNLDHQFITHTGYRIKGELILGRTDSAANRNNPYSEFKIRKENGTIRVQSDYAESPFYAISKGKFFLASRSWPASGHSIRFQTGTDQVEIHAVSFDQYTLTINGQLLSTIQRKIRRGIDALNLFQDDSLFMQSEWYSRETLTTALKQVMLLRNEFGPDEAGHMVFFVSSALFRFAGVIRYDQQILDAAATAFSFPLQTGQTIGWGIGYPERNRNQFVIHPLGADSFRLVHLYPVSYPLASEKDDEASTEEPVIQFLAANTRQANRLPGVMQQGFIFNAPESDSTCDFRPVLLSYRQERAGEPVKMKIQPIGSNQLLPIGPEQDFLLESGQASLSWEFRITDSFNWQLGSRQWKPIHWKLAIFGSLLFFCGMVLITAIRRSASPRGWVWQLLSCLLMILLTTRFFLYWRYKSFPPYDGMDLPSLQQLNSFWNFGILLLVTFLLAIVFGYDSLRAMSAWIGRFVFRKKERMTPNRKTDFLHGLLQGRLIQRWGIRNCFWLAWGTILLMAGLAAMLSGFSPSTCRHLAVLLILLYFLFSWFATTHSPLVTAAQKSWWQMDTNQWLHLLISNPVRLLLSFSLLALFAFIDIGFALVFLNFLLFHEAFHFINCSIAGLSAGSSKNARWFGLLAISYTLLFVVNLLYGPFIFQYLLALPSWCFALGYYAMALLLSYALLRLMRWKSFKRKILMLVVPVLLTGLAFIFLPREIIQRKAAMTRYRIDVLTMPAEEAIEKAYRNGDGYEPVIRAAQNQWFINTFIDEQHNEAVNQTGFRMLPHAPQNRGAKYNAQATDLVTSRFFIAEHGRWSALLYVLLLLLPVTLLASFYKLYPDFTNRINPGYAAAGTGFAILNYLLVTALLVILAATGRYVFFGQDLPFGSILSKQSILFPAILLTAVVFVFRNIPLQRYPNRRKLLPGALVFAGLFVLLFFIRPPYNREKDFGVNGLAEQAESYLESTIQPLWEEIDTANASRTKKLEEKDRLFAGRLREMETRGELVAAPAFLQAQLKEYAFTGWNTHLDPNRMLYLSLQTGKPRLAMNANYFHVEAPPHLQQLWRGSIYGDTSSCQVSIFHPVTARIQDERISAYGTDSSITTADSLQFLYQPLKKEKGRGLFLVNLSRKNIRLISGKEESILRAHDTMALANPARYRVYSGNDPSPSLLSLQPDAFMRNYYVNGSRMYYYPLGADFIWARNFAEGVASSYNGKDRRNRHLFLSLDPSLTVSLQSSIQQMLYTDSTYADGAAYAICIADGNGRILSMPDHIRGFHRPDPNDKTAFRLALAGKDGRISQSALRQLNGNLNLLRMNPGPGSTLKPIVFAAIASQLPLDWETFASTGFTEKQSFFGGEKVAPYDFEKNNGTINNVSDYIRYSDNYYHSNLLLIGSYPRQPLQNMLEKQFTRQAPDGPLHWPRFSYRGKTYWLNGFEHWPGYQNGKAAFGSDSSFVSAGLWTNFGIYTRPKQGGYESFQQSWDSAMMGSSLHRSGFILPEYALFDQQGTGMHMDRPNEVFMSAFRGHVKGSSQVMVAPLKMLDVFGKLVSQNRNYQLTLNPAAKESRFEAFAVDKEISYKEYLGLMKSALFSGMKQALFNGTAARLGGMLQDGQPYYYYAKTGTTGDDERRTKSKLFTLIISKKDIADPGFNFRNNRFVVIYFTSQNGPASQNEIFQAGIIRQVQESPAFRKYMEEGL